MALPFLSLSAVGQGVTIGTANPPDPSAVLDLQSGNQGLLVPRLTTAQRNAVVSPAQGLIIFNTTTNCMEMYVNASWKQSCFDCGFPQAIASAVPQVCQGDTIFLSVNTIPGASYSWSGPNGFSSGLQNPFIPNVGPNDAGTYIVIPTVSGCSGPPSAVSVSVSAVPGSFAQPGQTLFSQNVASNTVVNNNTLELATVVLIDGGTGADGAYNASGSVSLAAGTYNFTTFTIQPGATVNVTGNQPLVIKCQGAVTLSGQLNLNGQGSLGGSQGQAGSGTGGGQPPPNNGNNCGNWGAHGGGGSYGTQGTNGGTSATGCNNAHIGGLPGSVYGDAQITNLLMGSGGAGNGWCSGCNTGGFCTGGNGGGAVRISSLGGITVSGGITANGTNGTGTSVYASGSAGGGSGGTIHLISGNLTLGGTLTATGGAGGTSSNNSSYNCCGGNGGNGRIRFDYSTTSGVAVVTPAASVGTVSSGYASSGTSTTPTIAPPSLCSWGVLTFTTTTPSNTSVVVDVTDANGVVVSSNVSSGTDLSTIPAVAALNAIKLKYTLSSSNPLVTPTVSNAALQFITQ